MFENEIINNSWFRKCHKSNIPKIFINKTINDIKIIGSPKEKKINQKNINSLKDYLDDLKENVSSARGVIFCGPFGIGKTLMMSIVAQEVIGLFGKINSSIRESEFHNKLYFVLSNTLLDLIYRNNLTEEEIKIRRGVKSVSALCIDDILKFKRTKSEIEMDFLDEILRTRYYNGLVTFITSQVSYEELRKQMPRSILELLENNIVLTFVGDSQRGK